MDTDKIYSGCENPSDDEKAARKMLGLPIKKQLVYYPDKRNAESIVNVTSFQIVEAYDITGAWYTIETTTEDGTKARIHSSYLAEMQKPSFIADMAAQMM